MSGGMSEAENVKKAARQRYIRLKNDLSNNYILESVGNNLSVFRNTCSEHLKPGEYMNRSVYEIFVYLESKPNLLSYKNLTILKEIVGQLPVSTKDMLEAVDRAESEINAILSGGTAQPQPDTHNAPTQGVPVPRERDPGEGFHQADSHAVSYDDLESVISLNVRNSIGFIEVKGECGTGFRVGEHYIMTAYHVLADELETLFKMLKAMVDQSRIKNTDIRRKLATVSDQFHEVELDLGKCVEKFLEPSGKELQLAALASNLDTSYLENIKRRWSSTRITFNMKTNEELKFSFDLDIPFADKANDILILKLRSDDDNLAMVPAPLHLDEFSVDKDVHLIGYLKTTKPEKSLHININCQVYQNGGQLEEDINDAMKWWRDHLPAASLEACRYIPGKDETSIGRTIVHASKEFEHRSSGCPAVVIDDYTARRLLVQLIFLSGYPAAYYETGKKLSPPLQCCFESGVSMKNVALILLKAGKEDLKNAIFFT